MKKYWIIGAIVLGAVGIFGLKMWTYDSQQTDLLAEVRSCPLPNVSLGEMGVPDGGTPIHNFDLHGRVRSVRFERLDAGVRVSIQTHAGRLHEVEAPPLTDQWGKGGEQGNGMGITVHLIPQKEGVTRNLTRCQLLQWKTDAPDQRQENMRFVFDGDVQSLLFSYQGQFIIVIVSCTSGQKQQMLLGKTGQGTVVAFELDELQSRP